MALIFFQPQADLLFFSSAARFKGVNLAPKGDGVAGGDGYSSSQPARRLYGFIMLYGFNNPPQNLLMQK